MATYNDLSALKGSGTSFDKLIPLQLFKLKFPPGVNVPDDYVDFLLEIGAGELGASEYMLYDGLVGVAEVLGEKVIDAEGILLFGDDFQGYCAGFRTIDWTVVEMDPINHKMVEIAPNFERFIRNKIIEIS